jgi:hypothetical protein
MGAHLFASINAVLTFQFHLRSQVAGRQPKTEQGREQVAFARQNTAQSDWRYRPSAAAEDLAKLRREPARRQQPLLFEALLDECARLADGSGILGKRGARCKVVALKASLLVSPGRSRPQ